MGKIVLICSGGLDSGVMLASALSQIPREDIEVVNFNYGSKHNDTERQYLENLLNFYGLRATFIELPFIDSLFKSDLLKSGGEIPEGHYEDPTMQKTVVPFRNGIMLSIAVGFAESLGSKEVYYGNHSGDHAIYPDCRQEFLEAMSLASQTGTYKEVKIISPWVNFTKADIVKAGVKLNFPFDLTYSCYNGRERHCGKCGTCVERKEAFSLAGVDDPTEYEA